MNEKKTALEILKERSHAIEYHTKNTDSFTLEMQIVSAMQEYLAQETAALREENERLKEALKELIPIAEETRYKMPVNTQRVSFSAPDLAVLINKKIENAKKLTGKP